ncbi:MAG: TetR/AcrR family transcriptional regulator [Sphingopyxis sp.]|nr:TetR/AcrR family transcriptional regulator [Sphingopyxis sp.]
MKFSVDRFVPREGGYARGADGHELILKTALSVMIDHGYKAMTLRRIAAECGLKAGHISYYFKSKDDLVRALLKMITGSYNEAIEAMAEKAGDDPEKKLKNLIRFMLEDGRTKQAAYLFPELWALANHDPFVQTCVEEMYVAEQGHFEEIIAELNPALGDEDRKNAAVLILSSLEGVAIFAGYGKTWEERMDALEEMACDCFVAFVKAMKPGDAVATDGLSIA